MVRFANCSTTFLSESCPESEENEPGSEKCAAEVVKGQNNMSASGTEMVNVDRAGAIKIRKISTRNTTRFTEYNFEFTTR
jgi:hypothetical protein